MVPIVDTDVLVIGGGGAGARAALSAAESGARVMLALKGLLGRSGATAYRVSSVGGFQAATGLADPDDTPEEHFRDIVSAAQGMCSERLARVVASEAPRVLDDLVARGVELDTLDGRPREGDHPLHRGAARLFAPSLVPPEITGDGYALALGAGADLANLEYVQRGFGVIHPVTYLLSPHRWRLVPEMRNGDGVAFLPRYLPAGLSPEECAGRCGIGAPGAASV